MCDSQVGGHPSPSCGVSVVVPVVAPPLPDVLPPVPHCLQVVMDILGVAITCITCNLILVQFANSL